MQEKKKKPYLSALIMGIISIVSYVLIFKNQETVTDLTTKSGYFVALPIVAAFYFSFIHGAFASSMLSVLGIEAKKKK
ncbi:MAG: hypothetical protein AMK71_06120 [Nitrospira bacterium SG8_35_4]|nr:MAG: hypothetical protein AMK71_06120 [Nitrospira bacterium SG8_35_4]